MKLFLPLHTDCVESERALTTRCVCAFSGDRNLQKPSWFRFYFNRILKWGGGGTCEGLMWVVSWSLSGSRSRVKVRWSEHWLVGLWHLWWCRCKDGPYVPARELWVARSRGRRYKRPRLRLKWPRLPESPRWSSGTRSTLQTASCRQTPAAVPWKMFSDEMN